MDKGPINIPPKLPPSTSGVTKSSQGDFPTSQPIGEDRPFLGMNLSVNEWHMFLNQICKMFIADIKHHHEKMMEALKKFREEEEDNN
jgi:hypothetical protein